MGICAGELRHYVVRPTLKHMGMWSLSAENLLLGTAARESGLGFHLKPANTKALGIYQISPRMHRNIWDHFLAPKFELSSVVRGLASQREFLSHPHHELATNLAYSTAIAWLIYYRTGINIKQVNPQDTMALAKIWQKHFHSRCPGSLESFVDSYQQLLIDTAPSETQINKTSTAAKSM